MEDADPLERRLDAGPGRRLAGGGQDLEVLPTGQMTVEPGLVDDRADPRQSLVAMLRDRVAEERHRAGVCVSQSEQHPDEGGLSGTVGPEVSERTSTRHEELHAVDGDMFGRTAW